MKQLFSIPRLLHRGILAFLPHYRSLFLKQVTQGKEKCRCHGAFNKLIQKLCCYFYYVLCVENDSQSLAHTQGTGGQILKRKIVKKNLDAFSNTICVVNIYLNIMILPACAYFNILGIFLK